MKESIAVLVIVSAILVGVVVAHTEEEELEWLLKIDDGRLKVAIVSWDTTMFKITPAAAKYPEAVREACVTGDMVTVQTKDVFVITDLFHYRTDTVRTLGVKLYPGNIIDTWDDGKVLNPGEPKFFWFPVCWSTLLGALLIFIAFLEKVKVNEEPSDKEGVLVAIPAVIAIFAAMFLTGIAPSPCSYLFGALIFVAVIFFVIRSCVLHDKGRNAVLSGAVVLILMVVIVVLVYRPLLQQLF